MFESYILEDDCVNRWLCMVVVSPEEFGILRLIVIHFALARPLIMIKCAVLDLDQSLAAANVRIWKPNAGVFVADVDIKLTAEAGHEAVWLVRKTIPDQRFWIDAIDVVAGDHARI